MVGGTVMKLTEQRCVYSIEARKSTRKFTKMTETSSDVFSVMLPLSDCQRNSPKLKVRLLRGVITQYYAFISLPVQRAF